MATVPEAKIGDGQEWRKKIDGVIATIEKSRMDPDIVSDFFLQHIFYLVEEGQIKDLGAVQKHLRSKESSLQLFAEPIDQSIVSDPSLPIAARTCIDPITHEPRTHLLRIYMGSPDELAEKLNQYGLSHELNEIALTQDTGFLHEKVPASYYTQAERAHLN